MALCDEADVGILILQIFADISIYFGGSINIGIIISFDISVTVSYAILHLQHVCTYARYIYMFFTA